MNLSSNQIIYADGRRLLVNTSTQKRRMGDIYVEPCRNHNKPSPLPALQLRSVWKLHK